MIELGFFMIGGALGYMAGSAIEQEKWAAFIKRSNRKLAELEFRLRNDQA